MSAGIEAISDDFPFAVPFYTGCLDAAMPKQDTIVRKHSRSRNKRDSVGADLIVINGAITTNLEKF